MVEDHDWRQLDDNDPIRSSPSQPTEPLLLSSMTTLPFSDMPWEDFESLLATILRDVEALRGFVRLYGRPGQAQQGLDVLGRDVDGSYVAIQCKRQLAFSASDLQAAVEKFESTTRPYEVTRFVVATSASTRDTKIDDTLTKVVEGFEPDIFELWGADELTDKLRDQPGIVLRYFGAAAAKKLCGDYQVAGLVVPSPEAATVRDALGRTPEAVTGADQMFSAASETAKTDPNAALIMFEQGQRLLRERGFAPFAVLHEPDRADLQQAAGQGLSAVRSALDDVWDALEQGRSITASTVRRRLEEHSAKVDTPAANELSRVAALAATIADDLSGIRGSAKDFLIGDTADQARLCVLAGESALAEHDNKWLRDSLSTFESVMSNMDGSSLLGIRLRLLIADTNGEWEELRRSARKSKLGYDVSGLVLARWARWAAIRQDFKAADDEWDDSVGQATLGKHWADAEAWVQSRRAFRLRWKPFHTDELLTWATALRKMGPTSRILAQDDSAYESAMEALQAARLQQAAIAAGRALRSAAATGDWDSEERARRVVARALAAAGEQSRAAHHYAIAGDSHGEEMIGDELDKFIDNLAGLDAPNYWTVGTAFRFLAAEADLLPDEKVAFVAERIIRDLHGGEAGQIDMVSFRSSRYGGAVAAAAALGERFDVVTAQMILEHFGRLPETEPGRSRWHLKNEAIAVARIAVSHPSLAPRAIEHLVPVLANADDARNGVSINALDRYPEIADPLLRLQAQRGSDWALTALAQHDLDHVSGIDAEDALKRLTASLQHEAGVFTVGNRAPQDAVLIRGLKLDDIKAALAALMEHGDDRHTGSTDRGDYLRAAAGLVDLLPVEDRRTFFDTAFGLAQSPSASDHDLMEDQFRRPFSAVRFLGRADSRPEALYLASTLATSPSEVRRVRDWALSLLGVSDSGDRWLVAGLRALGTTGNPTNIAVLAAQRGWLARALAADKWAETGEPAEVGIRLANDSDPRVRRWLAQALVRQGRSPSEEVRQILATDARSSVRSLVRRLSSATTDSEHPPEAIVSEAD
jgi:hypothetical protein